MLRLPKKLLFGQVARKAGRAVGEADLYSTHKLDPPAAVMAAHPLKAGRSGGAQQGGGVGVGTGEA